MVYLLIPYIYLIFLQSNTFWYLTYKTELEIIPKSLENIISYFHKLAIKSPLNEYISKGIKIINLHLL